jgi:hypothetical protein
MFPLVEAAVVVSSLMLLSGGMGCKESSMLIKRPPLSDSISLDVTPPPFSDGSDENNSDENEFTAITDENDFDSSLDDTVARESFGVAELFRVGSPPPCRRRPRFASFSDLIEETAMTDENDESSDDIVLREIFDTLELGIESTCCLSAAVMLLWLGLVSSALHLSGFLIVVTA